MRMHRWALLLVVTSVAALGFVLAGETQNAPATPAKASAEGEKSEPMTKEPEHISVQHILIGFAGSARGTKAQRTPEDAKKLAHDVLERAKKGEDFDALVKQYTDDRPPGIYAMANHGVTPRTTAPREFERKGMVAAFGDVGFKLAVGEIGMSDYDPAKSPYGYHIIKRLE